MMKQKLALIVVTLLLLGTCAFAEGNPHLPYTGEAMIYEGLWDEEAEYGGDRNATYPLLEHIKSQIGNIEVNWQDTGDSREATATKLATGDIPDIFITVSMYDKHTTYDMEDLALDLRPYKEYMPNLFSIYERFPSYNNLLGENGEVYWIPQVCGNDMVSEFMAVNHTVAEELGITSWQTWDEFLAAMDAYKAAYPDNAPFVVRHGWGLGYALSVITKMTGCVGGDVWYNADGEWEYILTGSRAELYKESVEKLAYLYQNGYLRADQFTADGDTLEAVYDTGTSLFVYGYNCADHYTVTPMPDANMVEAAYRAGMYTYDGGFINKNVKNPEWLCAHIDYFLSEEASYMYHYGIEGETYEVDEQTGYIIPFPDYEDNKARQEYGMLNSILELQAFNWQKLFANHKSNDFKFEEPELALLKGGHVNPIDSDGTISMMSAEARETVSLNLTPIQTYVNEELFKFVEGTRSFDEWDAFVSEALSYGSVDAILEAHASGTLVSYPDEFVWMEVK